MRNWWIKGYVDGRKHPITGGPRNANGGFELYIYQRVEGSSVLVVSIEGIARTDGLLRLASNVHVPGYQQSTNAYILEPR